jgi:hypothetical protein
VSHESTDDENEGKERKNSASSVVSNGIPTTTTENPEDAPTTAEPNQVKVWGSTRQKLTIACLGIVYFASCASFSVLSPFFPNEVSK